MALVTTQIRLVSFTDKNVETNSQSCQCVLPDSWPIVCTLWTDWGSVRYYLWNELRSCVSLPPLCNYLVKIEACRVGGGWHLPAMCHRVCPSPRHAVSGPERAPLWSRSLESKCWFLMELTIRMNPRSTQTALIRIFLRITLERCDGTVIFHTVKLLTAWIKANWRRVSCWAIKLFSLGLAG